MLEGGGWSSDPTILISGGMLLDEPCYASHEDISEVAERVKIMQVLLPSSFRGAVSHPLESMRSASADLIATTTMIMRLNISG